MIACALQAQLYQRLLPRAYSWAAGNQLSTLVVAEHRDSKLSSSTLNTISAATAVGNKDVTVLVAGAVTDAVSQAAKNVVGVSKVLTAQHTALDHQLAEPWSALLTSLQARQQYTHILMPSSTFGRNILPRAAALLDCQPVSDVTEVINSNTYIRPIYAGNALETVQCSADALQMLTVRTTAFEQAATNSAGSVPVDSVPEEVLAAVQDCATDVQWQDEVAQKSDRPELSAAKIVISGGRALKTKENFQLLERLAELVEGAVGASRAAVDAGLCPNDMQVGQTGKIVAPQLYIALGISGAIQHVAGMKDSKCIVAINSDPDAPIFQLADYGLVGDLFKILPELEKEFTQLKAR